MVEVLEAVPNVSEGRDRSKIERLVDVVAQVGVDVLDWSLDPDHHRAVITYIGDPEAVEEASVAVARFALQHIDLREHRGLHPRVGSLDVLPFVPLHGLSMQHAVGSAHRVGRRIAGLGLPVYFYAEASEPRGRALADLRRGGFEALALGVSEDRRPDLPAGATRLHPTAGATCVGARRVLLAWNVFVAGLDVQAARRIASEIRERGGGFAGLRALGLHLPAQDRVQISMNLEDPDRTSPVAVFEAIEARVRMLGGQIEETEVIGMMPDTLVLPSVRDRLHLPDLGPSRVLSRRVRAHVSRHAGKVTEISDRTG